VFVLWLFAPALALADDCLAKCPTRKGPFGQPEVDRNCALTCLQQEERPPAAKPAGAVSDAPRLRFIGSWPDKDKQALIENLLAANPDRQFKAWAAANVAFEYRRTSGISWRAGARPGHITIYDVFWQSQRPEQESILAFELAKVLWFERINPGPREARTAREIEFEQIYRRYQKPISAMRFAAWRGADLGDLTDQDTQSWFSYAARVAMFNLPAPARAPRPYSDADWNTVRKEWDAARAKVREYLASLLVPGAGR
jgi:hypothetical protein